MDKSFNDQELSDIMKEIEALEEGFESEEISAQAHKPVLEELAQMDEKVSVPVGAAEVVSLDTKRHAASPETQTSMSFKVQGNMTLDLQFIVGGKVISLEVSESGLAIEMEGGVKFSVPVTDRTALKKAV